MSPVERGCLVIADIGGYTRYLTGVELEHSTDILADLLNVVVDGMTSLFTLSKLEGDAVFVHGPAEDGLVPMLDATYFGFRRRLRTILQRTTCRCNACRRIPDLDLKFVAHHGRYAVHSVAGREELVGPEVITVHRLLKNHVQETLGLDGYAFMTDACAEASAVPCERAGMTRHVEEYDDVGAIAGWVMDLHLRWEREQQREAVRIEAGEADLEFHADAPASPPVVWTWLTDPAKRERWQADLIRIEQENPDGVPGVGTTNHCVHGEFAVKEEVLDWKPFRYYTERKTVSGAMRMIVTSELEALPDGGTRVHWRGKLVQPQDAEALRQMAPMMQGVFDQGAVTMARLLEAEPRDGGEDGSAASRAGRTQV
ncbi:MAG: DUF2652 domain-containing protein [Actinobacteria bacterium]|nr:DUF2652 domain-containing protein [Actinomycetota bacterium]